MSENKSPQSGKSETGLRLALLVIGFGIGWLTGMSASPVVNIVIAAIVGVIAAFSPGRDAKETTDITSGIIGKLGIMTFIQLAWVVGGIVIGTTVGLTVRTHNLLSTIPGMPRNTALSMEVQTWAELTQLDENTIAKRLFANTYPYRDYSFEMSPDDVQGTIDFWSSTGISETLTAKRLFSLYYPSEATSPNPVTPKDKTDISADFLPSLLYGASGSVCQSLKKNIILYDGNLQQALQYTPSLRILSTITDTARLDTFLNTVLCSPQDSTQGNP